MRHLALSSLVLVALVVLAGCGLSRSGTRVQQGSSESSPPNRISSGTSASASASPQANSADSFTCPSLAEVVSVTGLTTFTKAGIDGHAVNKNNGQTMDTCAYSDTAQTTTINIMRLSVLPGYTFDDLKSQLHGKGELSDVSGLGSKAFEAEESAADSAGFDNNCHLVVNIGGTAVLQVVAGAESTQYSALCLRAETVAHLLIH